jgi:hypothetical protein
MKRGGRLRRHTPLRAKPHHAARAVTSLTCEAQTPVCTSWAVHVHHVLPRAHGGNDHTPLLDVCAPCHEYIHGHPALSYERGWLLHSWDDPSPAA